MLRPFSIVVPFAESTFEQYLPQDAELERQEEDRSTSSESEEENEAASTSSEEDHRQSAEKTAAAKALGEEYLLQGRQKARGYAAVCIQQ